MTFWKNVRPKVRAAFWVSLAGMVATLVTAVQTSYPTAWWVPFVALAAVPVGAWLKKEAADEVEGLPTDVADAAQDGDDSVAN